MSDENKKDIEEMEGCYISANAKIVNGGAKVTVDHDTTEMGFAALACSIVEGLCEGAERHYPETADAMKKTFIKVLEGVVSGKIKFAEEELNG